MPSTKHLDKRKICHEKGSKERSARKHCGRGSTGRELREGGTWTQIEDTALWVNSYEQPPLLKLSSLSFPWLSARCQGQALPCISESTSYQKEDRSE